MIYNGQYVIYAVSLICNVHNLRMLQVLRICNVLVASIAVK